MTYNTFIATQKLSNKIGIALKDNDVHIVKPLESRGRSLTVYGVCVLHGHQKTFYFYTSDYGKDRFKSLTTTEEHIKVRQYGDCTLVGSKSLSW